MGVTVALGSLLVTLALPVVLVVIVARALSRAREDEPEPVDPGIGTVRRVFLYTLAAVSLALAGSGLALLVGGILDAFTGELVIAESDTELAVALSLTVVGLPAWLVFMLLAQRSLVRHPVEARSLARWTYLLVVRAVALGVAVGFGIAVGRFLVGAGDVDGGQWGWLVVALAAWGGHQALAARHPAPSIATRSLDHLYLGFASVLGLYVLGFGLATAVTEPVMQAYDAAFRAPIARGEAWHEVMRGGLVQAAVGGLVWWWHWLARLRHQPGATTWHAVVFLFGILAALAVVVSTSAHLLYTVLAWLLAVPGLDAAEQHFAGVVPSAVGLLVGLASWVYHRAVLDERAPAEAARSDAERVYRYLVAAAGLLALAGGLASAFAMSVDAAVPAEGLVRGGDWWREQVAVTLTLLTVGGPLWWRYWSSAQRMAREGGPEEREALPRRAFLFLIFGIAVLVVLVNLAILLFQVFDAVLEGTFQASTVRDVRWSLALLLAAGAVSAYYWLVLRDDQAAAPPVASPAASPVETTGPSEVSAPLPPRQVVLVAAAPVAEAVEAALRGRGMRVHRWDRTDADVVGAVVPPEAVDALIARIAGEEARGVVVLVEADGEVRVLPAASVETGHGSESRQR